MVEEAIQTKMDVTFVTVRRLLLRAVHLHALRTLSSQFVCATIAAFHACARFLTTHTRVSVLTSLCVLPIVFLGCPQMMIERIEKLLPPPGYKPRYMNSSVPYDTLAKRYAEAVRAGTVDTTALYDEESIPDTVDSMALGWSNNGVNNAVSKDPALSSTEKSRNKTATSVDSGTSKSTPSTSAPSTSTQTGRTQSRIDSVRQTSYIKAAFQLFAMLPDSIKRQIGPNLTQGLSDKSQRDSIMNRIQDYARTLPSSKRDSLLNVVTSALARTDTEKSTEDTTRRVAPVAHAAPATVQLRSLDDTHFPERIELRTTVVDSAGRVVLGLAPPYYRGPQNFRRVWKSLTDSCNGQRTSIDSFQVREVRETTNDPYAIAFVIDHSGSMGQARIRKLREAVRQTMNIIARNDMVCVLPFAGSVGIDVPLTSDSAEYKRKLDIEKHARLIGGTSIHDAVITATAELAKAPKTHKKAILLFTDGEDNTSKRSLNDACRISRDSGVAVYSIAYGLTNEGPLVQLSGLSGGRFYRIYSTKEFPFAFSDIYRSLKNYYLISYTPPPCKGLHQVTYILHLPELGVRSLKGRANYDKSIITELDTVGSVTFVNIEFESGKAQIRESSLSVLDQIATTMRAHPTVVMEIRGHTDDRGSETINLPLSEQRASAVADALVTKGVGRDRLITHGFGSARPLVPNISDENRAKNRRTEFVLLKK